MAKPTEMELRVAKRIGAYYGLHGEKNVKKHINVARAAIRAMREPTEDMIIAGYNTMDRYDDDVAGLRAQYEEDGLEAVYVWPAMIDAASPQVDRTKRRSAECDEGIFTQIKIEYVKKTQKEKQG